MRATGIDEDLLSTLGVLEGDDPDVWDLALSGIGDPDRDDLVTDRQRAQRLLPAAGRHEIADENHHRRTPDEPARLRQRPTEIGRTRTLASLNSGGSLAIGRTLHPGDQLQQRGSARRWRDDRADTVVEEQRADTVAAADQELPDNGREFERQLPLEAAGGPPVERTRDIDEQPGIQATIGPRLPDVGTVRSRRDVPFDGPRVVAGLVLAHIAVLETGTAHARALVASRMKTEASEHRPARASQQLVDGEAARYRVRRQPGLPGRCEAAGIARARA